MSEERKEFINKLKKQMPRVSIQELLALKEQALPEKNQNIEEVKEAIANPFLHIASIEDWDELKDRVFNIEPLRNAARQTEKADVLLQSLNRYEAAARRTFSKEPEFIDNDTSVNIAEKIMGLLGDYLSQMPDYLERFSESQDIVRMAKTLDAYLTRLYVEKCQLSPEATVDDWINLDMHKSSMVTKETHDPAKKGKIYQVYIQPRLIRFLNSFAEPAQQYFMGSCCVYKFEA